MTNYREILRLDSLGLNKTQIADACDCSRTTVIAVIRRAEEVGICYPLPERLSDKELSMKLHPSAQSKPMYKMPDYEYVHKELQKSGVTLKLLWLEYCEKCRENGELPYQSTQFNKYYSDYAIKTNATMHLNHKPGEIMQVDWAGDTAAVIDTVTGEIISAYLFVASLPYSGYAYVEAFFSMNQECWIAAHVNAFKYFGGVTRILQCDNLKTGVISHGRTEVTLNKAYSEMAEHYGTAILPCRVRSPKDKAMVEGTVGVITNFVLGALRNRRFLSLPELNEAIWERLGILNNAPFQKREGSRATAFKDEKAFLLPLPPRPFELSEWKIATVAPNYHISILYQKTFRTDCISKYTKINRGERTKYLVSNNHPAIIDRETFKAVQSEMVRRSSKRKTSDFAITNLGKYSGKYALSELLVCGECGSLYKRKTWTKEGEKRIYWRCQNRIEHGSKYCKKSKGIEEKRLHETICRALRKMVEESASVISLIKADLAYGLSGDEGTYDVGTLEKSISDATTDLNDYMKQYNNTGGDKAKYIECIQQTSEKIRLLRIELDTAKAKISQNEKINQEVERLTKWLTEHDVSFESYDDVVVRRMVELIRVNNDNTITVFSKFGSEIVEKL